MLEDSKIVWFLKFGSTVQKLLKVENSAFYIFLMEKWRRVVIFQHLIAFEP